MKRAPRGDETRSTTLTVRLTPSERALVEQRASAAHMTPSGYLAHMVRNGRVVIEQREGLAAPLMAELSRIGNNINQLAHAANAGTPPASQDIMKAMQELFAFMMSEEITRRRVDAFKEQRRNDSSAAQARNEFQGRGGVPVPR